MIQKKAAVAQQGSMIMLQSVLITALESALTHTSQSVRRQNLDLGKDRLWWQHL